MKFAKQLTSSDKSEDSKQDLNKHVNNKVKSRF